MEENLALALYGCKLAKDLENNLQMLGSQPDILLMSCEEILRVFSSIRDRILSARGQISNLNLREADQDQGQQFDLDHIGAGIPEWLRSGGTTTGGSTNTSREPLDLLNVQGVLGDHGKMKGMLIERQQTPSQLEFTVQELGVSRGFGSGTVGEDAPDSSRTSSSQRQRRR